MSIPNSIVGRTPLGPPVPSEIHEVTSVVFSEGVEKNSVVGNGDVRSWEMLRGTGLVVVCKGVELYQDVVVSWKEVELFQDVGVLWCVVVILNISEIFKNQICGSDIFGRGATPAPGGLEL